jgi:4-hydroxybenzoate polyprenyltransferase
MKRWTNWPQAWLGFAMNWGFIPGYVSVTNQLDLPLFGSMILGLVA